MTNLVKVRRSGPLPEPSEKLSLMNTMSRSTKFLPHMIPNNQSSGNPIPRKREQRSKCHWQFLNAVHGWNKYLDETSLAFDKAYRKWQRDPRQRSVQVETLGRVKYTVDFHNMTQTSALTMGETQCRVQRVRL